MAAKSESAGFASLEDERPALIPPGTYRFRFLHHETKQIFKHPKLYLWFSVIDFGDHFETRIPRYYGARRIIGAPRIHGRFAIGYKSDFLREFFTLFPARVDRLDRVPMSSFENCILVGRVRTVDKGHGQRAIPEQLQYSVIAELLRVERL